MISFTVPGTPVPQGRPRFNSITKKTYYDDKTTAYRDLVKRCAIKAQNGCDSLTGALAMIVDCTFPIPTSWPKYKQREAVGKWHIEPKDTDNICKAVADSCNGIIYDDDKQIAVLIGFKHYGVEPEARVTVFELSEDNSPCWLIAHLKKEIRFYEK